MEGGPGAGKGPKLCSMSLSIRNGQRLGEDVLFLTAEVHPCQKQKDGPVHPSSRLLSIVFCQGWEHLGTPAPPSLAGIIHQIFPKCLHGLGH